MPNAFFLNNTVVIKIVIGLTWCLDDFLNFQASKTRHLSAEPGRLSTETSIDTLVNPAAVSFGLVFTNVTSAPALIARFNLKYVSGASVGGGCMHVFVRVFVRVLCACGNLYQTESRKIT